MVEIGGCLYVAGGTNGGVDLSSVERYDPRVSFLIFAVNFKIFPKTNRRVLGRTWRQ